MNMFMPSDYLQFLAGVFFMLSVIFLFLSLAESISDRCMQSFAILSIVGVSLIANHAGIYFAVVFIIATAATELEFLQNLAAIVRGSKDYFDYKKINGAAVVSDGISIKRVMNTPNK